MRTERTAPPRRLLALQESYDVDLTYIEANIEALQ
jgi:hypothetical protein